MKIIVAGSRDFSNYILLKQTLDSHKHNNLIEEIVSGGARGADRLGEEWAKENGVKIKRFEADWVINGRAAGPIRNHKMAEYGDYLILFWDGQSAGSKNMLETMRRVGKPYKVIYYSSSKCASR